ncbi:MAG: hypothetical protein P8009_04545 [Gammaproteobacteria bacterium]
MATMSPTERRHVAESVATGSTAEIIGGVAAVVLAILGLANVAPGFMLTIATIAVGAALVFEGGALAAEYSKILSSTADTTLQTTEVGGGMTAEMMGGIAGIVLGILALLGLDTMTLSASALIVFGATLAVSAGMTSRLNELKIKASEAHETAQKVAHEAVTAAADTQVLVGVAAAVLGILALVGIAPMPLALIGLLAVGASVLLSGSAVGGRLLAMFRR